MSSNIQGSISLTLKDKYQSGSVIMTTSILTDSLQLFHHLVKLLHLLLLLHLRANQHNLPSHQHHKCHTWKWTKRWIGDMLDSSKENTKSSNKLFKRSRKFGNLSRKERCLHKDTKLLMKLQKLDLMYGVSIKSSKIHTTILSHKSSHQTSQLKNLLIPSLLRSQPMLNQRVSLLKHQVKARRKRKQHSPIITLTSNTTE